MCIGVTRYCRHPRTSILAEMLGEVMEINSRLAPYMERYQTIMAEDPQFDDNVSALLD